MILQREPQRIVGILPLRWVLLEDMHSSFGGDNSRYNTSIDIASLEYKYKTAWKPSKCTCLSDELAQLFESFDSVNWQGSFSIVKEVNQTHTD